MANVNQEIDTIRVGNVDYEISDPHALYGEHDESAPDLTDVPLYESDLVTQVTNDSTKPSAANVPYALKQQIDQISSDLASVLGWKYAGGFTTTGSVTLSESLANASEIMIELFLGKPRQTVLIESKSRLIQYGLFPDFMTSDGRVYAEIAYTDATHLNVTSLSGLSAVGSTATLNILIR